MIDFHVQTRVAPLLRVFSYFRSLRLVVIGHNYYKFVKKKYICKLVLKGDQTTKSFGM